ncbi:hypothetical protein [Blastomonas fulva]|jgi:hypothetical protein|uniref:hypothetical protein n=1 Tax=Blastomonas fulva TaxID=1550728 RepID=UPI0025A3E4C4|nr:hypothetical protein [Blastomonas fulva]MDM7929881.1 hypothetical protein [Blastomonas fulva]MDM7966842.1 hypothetical protein [Blastomonas fulva]
MKAISLPVLSVLLPVLLVSGCADPEPARQREPGGQAAGERLGASDASPTARPVSIGEGGTRFAACQGRGRVGGLRGAELPVRDAPFDGAKQVGALTDDTHVFVCTRSLDQQWLGVVVGPSPDTQAEPEGAAAPPTDQPAPAAAPAVDCGVTRPVRSKQPYSGPCLSGWVENTFVAAVAN